MKVICQNVGHSGLDLYIPESTIQSQVLLAWVHGGAWITGDRKNYSFLGTGFAKENLITALLGYRLTKKDQVTTSHFPDAINDLVQEIEWLYHNSVSVIGYRPKYLVLGGHSAGAQLTGLIALQKKWLTAETGNWILGVIGVEGIYDIPRLAVSHPTFVDWFLKWQFPDSLSWKEASPQWVDVERRIFYAICYSMQDEYRMESQSDLFFAKIKGMMPITYQKELGGSHDGILLQENLILFILKSVQDWLLLQ